MNLVLFDDALEHLTRIHRVIRMDKGNALLVGVGGSGKASRKARQALVSISSDFHFSDSARCIRREL